MNIQDGTELRSEEVEDILNKVPNWMIRWGNTLIILVILSILILSWVIKYPEVIKSGAVLTTFSPPEKKYTKSNINIKKILQPNGAKVLKNEPIMVLENSGNYKDILFLQSILDTLIIQKVLSFPYSKIKNLTLGPVSDEYAIFENYFIEYELNSKFQPLKKNGQSLNYSLDQMRNRYKDLVSQRKMKIEELSLKKKNIDRYHKLYKNGVVASQEYENKQIEFLAFQSEIKNFDIMISQLKDNINILTNDKRTNDFSERSENLTLYKNTIQSLDNLKNAISDWKTNYLLIANIDGEISYLNQWVPSQLVTQGTLLYTIVPQNNSKYLAELRTPINNSGKIKIGQKVKIDLANFPSTEFGSLYGYITSKSLLPNENGYYYIQVTIPDLITTYNKKIPFNAELEGDAEIITEDLRLIERVYFQFKSLYRNNV